MEDARPDTVSHSESGTVGAESREGRQKRFSYQIGDLLEYRMLRLLQYQGYYVRRGKIVFTTRQLDQATDIDVLAVGFDRDLNRDVVVAECKSGRDAGLDRVFWLAGLARFVGANRAILVRRPTRWNITDFARDVGVEILSTERLNELEHSLGITDSYWPGVSDRPFFEKCMKQWNAILRTDELLTELSLTYAIEFRFRDPFPAINFHVHHLRGLVRRLNKTTHPEERQLISYLVAEAISQLCVFLMALASRTKDLNRGDRRKWITEGLTYGDVDAGLAHKILRHAYKVAEQSLLQLGIDRSRVGIDEQFFRMPAPDYVGTVLDIVDRLISHSHHAAELPALMDLILMERMVKGNTARGWLREVFPYSDLSRRVELVRELMAQFVQIDAFPQEMVNTLFGSRGPERLDEPAQSPGGQRSRDSVNAGGREVTSPQQLNLPEMTERPQSLDESSGQEGE